MSVARVLWLPRRRDQLVSFLVALIAVSLLGLRGIPTFPAFREFHELCATTTTLLAWSAVLEGLIGALLWSHVRNDYLTWQRALQPYLLTLLLLSVIFPAAWLIRLCFSDELQCDQIFRSPIEWEIIVRIVFTGLGGLCIVLSFSGVWKSPTYPASALLDARCRALSMLRPMLLSASSRNPVTNESLDVLLTSLEVIQDESKKIAALARDDSEAALAQQWRTAASHWRRSLNRHPRSALVNAHWNATDLEMARNLGV